MLSVHLPASGAYCNIVGTEYSSCGVDLLLRANAWILARALQGQQVEDIVPQGKAHTPLQATNSTLIKENKRHL